MSSTKLQELIDAQNATTRAIYDTACCGPGGSTQISGDATIEPVGVTADEPPLDLTDPATWPPDYFTDPTGATPYADLSALAERLCIEATAVFDLFLDFLVIAGWFAEFRHGLSTLLSEVVRLAMTRLDVTATGSLTAFAYEFLGDNYADMWLSLEKSVIDQARTEIEAARDQIVCAWANADTWANAVAASALIIQSVVTNATMSAWVIGGGLLGFAVALVFRLWADPEEYACGCEPVLNVYSWTFDTDGQGWAQQGGTDAYASASGNPAGSVAAPAGEVKIFSPPLFVDAHTLRAISFQNTFGGSATTSVAWGFAAEDYTITHSYSVSVGSSWTTRTDSINITAPKGRYRLWFAGTSIRQVLVDNITLTFSNP